MYNKIIKQSPLKQFSYIKTHYSTNSTYSNNNNNNNNNSNNNNISNKTININNHNNNEDIKLKNRIQVKNLYKQFLYLGRIGFLGVDYIRDRAKPQFMKNSNLTDQDEINKCIDRAKYVLKEVEAMNRFHKYRSLKKSYDPEFQHIRDDLLNLYHNNNNNNNSNNNSNHTK